MPHLAGEADQILSDSVINPTTATRPLISMLKYAIIFLTCAIMAGIFGFNVLTGTAAVLARVGFVISLVLLAGSLLYDPTRRRSEI